MFTVAGSLLAWSAIAQIKRSEAHPIVRRNAWGGIAAAVVGLVILATESLWRSNALGRVEIDQESVVRPSTLGLPASAASERIRQPHSGREP